MAAQYAGIEMYVTWDLFLAFHGVCTGQESVDPEALKVTSNFQKKIGGGDEVPMPNFLW